MVSDGTEFAVGDIEGLFDEARRNTKAKHEKWAKYYDKRRRDVKIRVNDSLDKNTFFRFSNKENTAVETVATVSMQIAAKEAKDVSGHSDITVAIDGTSQNHGHTSLNGAVIATSFYIGKVLDA
ncbi:hypothetical protein TNCV_3264771 [Trichonephila clavipes]|nr:hypothetical protein TNCV_3264771 [Trichonephila clavipes]